MKYCTQCGSEINDNAVICVKCGCSVEGAVVTKQAEEDKPNTGFALLGFFFPVVGLVLYLIWKSTTPLKAKSCGKGALIGFIVGVVFYVIYFIVIFAFGFGSTLSSFF